MRLKRKQNDFRLAEVVDEGLNGPGDWTLYRVTKRGVATTEAAAILAREAGVEAETVTWASMQGRDGISTQYMTVPRGRPVSYRDPSLLIRPAGSAVRPLGPGETVSFAYEIVLRDMTGDDMRRVRHNLAQVVAAGLVNYFDDPRFGCLRHGQGFIVRRLVRGDVEGALKDFLTAPSPFGADWMERYKAGLARRWGDWRALAAFARGGRGASLFHHLRENPGDFEGALRVGISSRERTIHLFAYQSHLWNAAASLWIRDRIPAGELVWVPSDDGSLPMYRELSRELQEELGSAVLPLYGEGVGLSGTPARHYEAVFRSEGVDPERFLALDLPGFRPRAEDRPLISRPSHLRAAPAERDDLYRKGHKMRLRFTLPRGQYPTLVTKRLAASVESDAWPPRLWVSRHCLDFPDSQGRMRPPSGERRRPRSEGRRPGPAGRRPRR